MLNNAKAFSSFSVNDTGKAKDFYGRVLGLKVMEKADELEMNLDGSRVIIYPKANHEAASFTLLNFPVEDIEATVIGLAQRGVRMEPYDDGKNKTDENGIFCGSGPKVAWFKDPAGNLLSVVQAE